MRIIIVGPEIEENLGLRSLQAILKEDGHDVAVLPFSGPADLARTARAVLRRGPELVGFSLVAQRRFADFDRLAAMLRDGGFQGHVTAGGHFASLRAHEVLSAVPGIDTVLHHDGEERIARLASWLDAAEGRGSQICGDPPADLDGISWRAADGSLRHRRPVRVPDVDALPIPARRRPDRTLGFARAPIVASRGCSGSCSFCSIHAWHGQVPASKRLRFRSPEGVAEEMSRLHREHDVRVYVFHDDDFLHPDPRAARARARAILDRAARGIGGPFAFVIKCRPDDVDPELFGYLKEMGLVRAYVGIETHSRLGLRTLNRRVDAATNLRALATLRDLGVFACFNLLLFHPDTTIEELDENLSFLTAHTDLPFDVARTELYACSPLETRMIREGRAIGDFRGYDYRIADPRAETVFRLFSEVLWERHFGGDSILHLAQDLGYRASLLRQLAPAMAASILQERVDRLIRDVNADTIAHLRDLVRFAGARGFTPECTGDPALAELRREVAARIDRRRAVWRACSLEIELRATLGRAGLGRLRAAREIPDLLGRFAIAAPPAAAFLLGMLSCGDSGTTVCDPPPPPYRYSDIEPRIQTTCAKPGCHSAQTAAAGLVLSTGAGRANLVNVPSTELPAMKRVEPAKPDSSYLYRKLTGTQQQAGGSGEQMPLGSPPDQDLIFRVRGWISEAPLDD